MTKQRYSMREGCGIVGIALTHEDAALPIFYALYALQHRGQESAGIAVSGREEFRAKGNGIGESAKDITLESGFDTKSVTLSELLSVLTRYIDRAEIGNYFHVLGIASVTGFDKKVLEHINSYDFHKNFVSRYASLCLADLETGAVFYNESDERIKAYIDLFKPVFDEEKVRAIKEYVVGRLELKDFAVLDRVVEEATDGGEEGKRLAKKAFYDLEKEGMGKVKYDKEFGVVVER